MNISIVGLGYVGTVSAGCLSAKGHRIWGVDINSDKVRMINEGRAPIIEPGLDLCLRRAHESGRLRGTCDPRVALAETELCFVSVATPSRPNGQIDATHLLRACRQIATALSALNKRQTVVIRSSVLPSIFDSCRRAFESFAPGLVDLCVNPEFLREGTAILDFEDPPFTVVGAESTAAQETLRTIYSALPAPILMLAPKEALMLKYASNAFHALKVSFANEMGLVCQQAGVDAEAVMTAFCSDTKLNISARYLMPGFAFGGSCLPKDVRAIVYAGRQHDLELPLTSAILSSNKNVIDRAFARIQAIGARRVALVGLSFKSSTDDLRESPFVELAERLLGKGYTLRIYDPNVTCTKLIGANKEYIDRVIPHLSRLLVSSLDELADAELVLVGHEFEGLGAFLQRSGAPVLRLGDHSQGPRTVRANVRVA